MKSIRFDLRNIFQSVFVAAIFFISHVTPSQAQIEEVLDSSTETQDFPSWLKGSYFFKTNKALLESAATTKDKHSKTDETSLRTLEDYQTNLANLKKIELPFRLFLFNTNTVSGKIDGVVRRQYFTQDDQSYAQQFREAIEIKKPESLSKYRWITFRFFDLKPDRVWIKSPNIAQARPVSWYLRAEPLFYSPLVANDLFGTSEKLSDFETTIEPDFVTIPAAISGTDAHAPPIDSLSSDAMIPGFTVALRQAVVAQLTIKDPFAKIGQLKVIIDRATGIPLYKATLNRKGDVISVLVQALPAEPTKEQPEKSSSPLFPTWGFKEILRPQIADKSSPSAKATILYGAHTAVEKIAWAEESFDPNL